MEALLASYSQGMHSILLASCSKCSTHSSSGQPLGLPQCTFTHPSGNLSFIAGSYTNDMNVACQAAAFRASITHCIKAALQRSHVQQ